LAISDLYVTTLAQPMSIVGKLLRFLLAHQNRRFRVH
jgi:hypothetical protein